MSLRKVLIVEDEMIVQLHLARIVAELGYEVVGTAMNTREALALGARAAPALVLMDIHLADGDDGVETAKKLIHQLDCAVIFVTAYADQATVARTEQVGAAGYLVKPFTAAAVRAAIATAFVSHERLQRAKQQARSFSSVLESMGDALLLVDEHDRITFANPKAVQLTGWPASEAEGRGLLEVVDLSVAGNRELVQSALAEARRGRRPVSRSQLEIHERQGGERTVDIQVEPVNDADELDAGLVVKLRDRTAHTTAAVLNATRHSFGAGTRLLVYSHDTFGLGHLRRCLALIRTLCGDHPKLSALLVTGSPMVHRYPMPVGSDYVKLPAIRKVESEQYEARTLQISGSAIRSLRSNLILHTVRDYDPNVLLVDHSPTGSKGELLASLEWLATRGGCTRILGLRDIIDEPSAVIELWRETGVYEVLRSHYDHLVVYGNRAVYDPIRSYEFPAGVAAKAHFVNYVCDRSQPIEAAGDALDRRPLVAVSIGGGDGGGETVIGPFLEMLRRFKAEIDYRAEILTGPFVAPELEARLRELARDLPVTLKNFIPSTAALYRQAELVVSTAGYNTVTDLLAHAQSAVLIPRVLYRQEQLIRARRLAELGLVTCLAPDEVTPESLFAAIQHARTRAALTRGRAQGLVPLDGAERFSAFCGGLQVEAR